MSTFSHALRVAILASLTTVGTAALQEPEHFDASVKKPSPYTIAAQQHQRAILPLSDKRDFDEASRGLIAVPSYQKIMTDTGGVAWDLGRWDFLLQGKDFDSIHPSLQRQAILNMSYGLYEVVPGIYQGRGFDLANITFIKGQTGWIVIDPLTVKETARAALQFVNEQLGTRPVVAVIISHSHGDHFGGIRGVITDAALKAGKVQIIAPSGFMNAAMSENLFGGNAMARRKTYAYGDLLPQSPFGHVDASIGKAVAVGSTGILAPTKTIEQPFEDMVIDGVKMTFQLTPGTEAPAEMNTWFPDFKALWMAENVVNGLHNVLTLRGAPVRDPLAWSKHINEDIYRYGTQADVIFASHTWPHWGKERILEVLRGQRDMYANLNNQVLHLANSGVTINQINNVYNPPESLQNQWFARGYHGTYRHNSKAVIQRYFGYWDGNPTNLVPLSPEDTAPLYVEMMGGAGKILRKGRALYQVGQYRLAMEIVNKLVYAQPYNQNAKQLLADIFEQLGYQDESPSIRNPYLSAAKELRDGVVPVAKAAKGPDLIRGTPTDLFLDYIGIKVDSDKAKNLHFKINLITPDNGEKFVIEMSNSTLTNIKGYQAAGADLTITVNRSDLEEVMVGNTKLADLVKAGKAQLVGDTSVLKTLASTMGSFDPWFEIMPGTKTDNTTPAPSEDLFEDDAPSGADTD